MKYSWDEELWDGAQQPKQRWFAWRRSVSQLDVFGLRHERTTTTAADALEVDMPPRHERNRALQNGADGHGAIVP